MCQRCWSVPAQETAAMFGYSSVERFLRPPRENWAAQSSLEPWSSGTNWVWSHTTDSFLITMPKGGLGNLIALPLQKIPRAEGNSVFVDSEFLPYPDQWAFLGSVERMSPDAVEAVVLEAQKRGDLIGVRISIM